jgi:hypothetical protein
MTTYDPGDQAERRRVVRNDERVRNGDTSTYLDHATVSLKFNRPFEETKRSHRQPRYFGHFASHEIPTSGPLLNIQS